MSLPDCSCTPTRAVCLNLSDNPASLIRTAEFHQNLIQDEIVQYLESGGSEPVRKNPGLTAVLFNQFS
jgi:hypothetical protein